MSGAGERTWCTGFAVLLLSLLLLGLGKASLWEDEAASAVLGARTLQHGLPYAWDGRNRVTRERGMDANDQGLWIFEPWLVFYITAASLALCGHTQFGARFLLALCGWLAALLVVKVIRDHSNVRGAPLFAAALFATSAPYLLYCRQSRYYPLIFLFESLFMVAFLNLRLAVRPIAACALAILLLFYTHPLSFAIFLPGALVAGWLFGREKSAGLAISIAAALSGALPWVLYSGMLRLGTVGTGVFGSGIWGIPGLLRRGVALVYTPYYLAGCAATAACLPLLRVKTIERLQGEALLKLAIPLFFLPAGVATYLAAVNVSSDNERYGLVTLMPGLLILSLLLGSLAHDRPWLGWGLLVVFVLTPFGMISPLSVNDTLPTLRGTPLHSPLLALARECALTPSSPTDAIVHFLRPRVGGVKDPTLFVDWNPEGVMFCLPAVQIVRDLPFSAPPRWIVLPDAGPSLLNYTIIRHVDGSMPDRATYALTARRPAMEAAPDFAYVLDYVMTHPYRAVLLQSDLAGDNSPEFFAHSFAASRCAARLTLYEYRGGAGAGELRGSGTRPKAEHARFGTTTEPVKKVSASVCAISFSAPAAGRFRCLPRCTNPSEASADA